MIHVDEEFKSLIPPLSREEYKLLEESCVKEGIRDPLVVWKLPGNEILIDGHNRWEISAHHAGIPFKIVYKEFESRDAVKEWIIKNQLGRRNIPPFVRAELALKLKPVIAEKAKKKQSEAGGAVRQKSDKAVIDTKKELAKAAGVSHDTIHKVEEIKKKEKDIPKTIEALRKGETSINKVYSDIKAAENENRRQREERELREAKKRHEGYQDREPGTVTDFTAAKQDKVDSRLIFEDWKKEFDDMWIRMNRLKRCIYNKEIKNILKAANEEELKEVANRLDDCRDTILRARLEVEEINEE